MCVIVICKENFISEEEIIQCHIANPDGIGIAWREKDYVYYKKGFMELDEFLKWYSNFQKKDIFPHIMHFRLATSGGIKRNLTHPFPISFNNLNLEGKTKEGIIFHNGVISNWENYIPVIANYCIQKSMKFPKGPFSDTRLAAILVKILGKNILEILNGKWVYFTPQKLKTYGYFISKNGILFSNLTWQKKSEFYSSNKSYYPIMGI